MYEFASRPPLRLEMTYTGENSMDFTLINMHLKCCNDGYNRRVQSSDICLLYTSDAADDRTSVDLGGRLIIKKKN